MNKISFLKTISQNVLGAKESAKNYGSVAKGVIKGIGTTDKLANKMMEKRYVLSTMGNQTWDKRKEETKKLIKQGKMVQARTNLDKLKEQFKKDNS